MTMNTTFMIVLSFFLACTAVAQEISSSDKAISITVDDSWSMTKERNESNEERTFKNAKGDVIIITYNKEMAATKNANILSEDLKPDLKILAIAPQLKPTDHSDSIVKVRDSDAYKVKAYFNSQGIECQIMVLMGYYDIGFWQISFIGRKDSNWDNYESLAKTIKIKSP